MFTLLTAPPGHAYTGDVPLANDPPADPNIFETTLIADETSIDIKGSGPLAEMFAFNGTVPGPEIRVTVGDRVIVHVENQLDEAMTVHWHGIELGPLRDGTPVTQNPILPGGTFDYDFSINTSSGDPLNDGGAFCNTCHDRTSMVGQNNCGDCHRHGDGGRF